MNNDRELIKQLYFRICRDSGYRLSYLQVAAMVSEMMNLGSPLIVWCQFNGIAQMEEIANGKHPICDLDKLLTIEHTKE
jgi:hypothetical protein